MIFLIFVHLVGVLLGVIIFLLSFLCVFMDSFRIDPSSFVEDL